MMTATVAAAAAAGSKTQHGAGFHIKVNASYCDSGPDDEHHQHLNNGHEAKCLTYDLGGGNNGGDSFELTQTTQPLISLSDRDQNGYKDKISGSSRYASTTSTLADERL